MVLRNQARVLLSFVVGFLNSLMLQYTVNGSEIIPIQVIRFPNGIESSLSKDNSKRGEPVVKSAMVNKVRPSVI